MSCSVSAWVWVCMYCCDWASMALQVEVACFVLSADEEALQCLMALWATGSTAAIQPVAQTPHSPLRRPTPEPADPTNTITSTVLANTHSLKFTTDTRQFTWEHCTLNALCLSFLSLSPSPLLSCCAFSSFCLCSVALHTLSLSLFLSNKLPRLGTEISCQSTWGVG